MNFEELEELNEEHKKKHFNSYTIDETTVICLVLAQANIAAVYTSISKMLTPTRSHIKDMRIYFLYDTCNLTVKQQGIIKAMNCSNLMEKYGLLYNYLFDKKGYLTDCSWHVCENVHVLNNIKPEPIPMALYDEIHSNYVRIMKENEENENERNKIKRIVSKIFNDGMTDTRCATLYSLLNKEKNIYDEINDSWYVINKYNIWIKDKKGNKIITAISNSLVSMLSDEFSKFIKTKKTGDKGFYVKNFHTTIKFLESNVHKKNVLNELKGIVECKKIFEKMDNVNNYLFAFDNGVYDFKSFSFRLPKPSELISVTCGYCYEALNASNKKYVDDIEKILASIMETKDDVDTVLMQTAQCLIGEVMKEEFYLWRGDGGNGKGVLRDLIKATFGEYYDSMEIDYINKTKQGQSATSADPIMARKKNCRIVVSTEPESDVELRINKIKQWSGGDDIQCRALYGDSFNFVAKFKLIIQSNFDVTIKNTGKSVTRRFFVTKFPYSFTDNPINEYEKLADNDLKARIKLDNYKIAFFHVLLPYYKKWVDNGCKIICSQNVLEQTQLFLSENDTVSPFYNEIIIKDGDDKSIVSSSDLYKSYKQFYFGENKTLNIQEFRTALSSKGLQVKGLHGKSIYRGIRINNEKLNECMKEKIKNKNDNGLDNLEIIDM